MISIRQVTHSGGLKTILDAISVELSAPRTAVIGANGSGKSTFARLINGLVVPDQGQVVINGLDTRKHSAAIRRQVGFVFQNPDIQFVFPTVEEDLAFGLKNRGLTREQINRQLEQTLSRYGLDSLRHQPVHTLSGGEKQLLCVAAVLVMQPQIIVLDEPTTLLDLANTHLINQTLSGIDQQTVIVTHDLEFASHCDQALLIDRGKLVSCGDPDSVITDYLKLVDRAGAGC